MKTIADFIYEHVNYECLESPIGAMLCITSKCNLRCNHCYNESGIENDIDDYYWLRLIEDILQHKSIKCVSISGGEPLLRLNLLKKILSKLSANSDIRILITTNGCFITNDLLSFLTSLPNTIELQFSLDGHNSEINSYTRNDLSSFNKTVDGIKKCLGFKKLVVSTNCSLNKFNIQYIDNYLEIMTNLKVNNVMFTPVASIGRATKTSNYLLSIDEKINFIKKSKSFKEKYNKLNITIGSPGGIYDLLHYVSHPIDWLIVKSNGDVKLSIRYPYTYGNIQVNNIQHLWNRMKLEQKDTKLIDDMIKKIIIQEDTNVELFK